MAQRSKRYRAIARDIRWMVADSKAAARSSLAGRDAEFSESHGFYGHWSCGRKQRFTFEDDARVHAVMCRETTGVELWPYRCGICGGWHLTSRR